MVNDNKQSVQDLYYELSYYTMSHSDPSFIHQHIVDAFAAQNADEQSKPIGVVFALVGLYLHIEKNFNGRQVQQTHMQMAKKRKVWPKIIPPNLRGAITISDVLKVPPGNERDDMIHKWCVSVWESWRDSRHQILNLMAEVLNIE
jgi:hypothetical protein